MKKLIILTALLIGFYSFSQERKEKPNRENNEKLTPKQRNEKRLKKLTADLSLNTKQQEQVDQIIMEQDTKRIEIKTKHDANKASNMKINSEERAEFKKQMMDEKTAMDTKMKTILSAEQFDKWNSNNEKKRKEMEKRMSERRMKKE